MQVMENRVAKHLKVDAATGEVEVAEKLNGKKKKEVEESKQIVLRPINLQVVEIPIIGDSSLIVHKFSTKSIRQMEDKHAKKAQKAREKRDPHQEYRDAMYIVPGKKERYGVRASSFKAAAVGACRQLDKGTINMTLAKGLFHIIADYQDLLEIHGKPQMRTDVVRLSNGAPDLRYRPEFLEWKAVLRVKFNADVISLEQLINLFNLAGFASGVGEWRPASPESCTGDHGMFHVAVGDERKLFKGLLHGK